MQIVTEHPIHDRSLPLAVSAANVVLVGCFVYETYAAWRRPRDGTAVWLAGRPFDSRGLWETVADERRVDPSSVSYVIPRALLTHHLILESWEPEEVAHVVQPNWGIVVDGVQTLPLSGIANRRTVFGNESGTRIIYDSDERGFNNPRGIWDSGNVRAARGARRRADTFRAIFPTPSAFVTTMNRTPTKRATNCMRRRFLRRSTRHSRRP